MFLVYHLFLYTLLLDGVEVFEEGMKYLLAELKETYMPTGMLSSHTVQWSHIDSGYLDFILHSRFLFTATSCKELYDKNP